MTRSQNSPRQHSHIFYTDNPLAERGAKLVMWITLITMVAEITGGWWYNSMALLADGWHMSSHTLALGLSALAYSAARRFAKDPRFAFGTWKIEILAGYTSALLLMAVALAMVISSIERFIAPVAIHYQEALAIAILGLLINLICAYILGTAHHHGHDHKHGHHHHDHSTHKHHDLNLMSAYIHVLTDAVTSVLAIIALMLGWLYGWAWFDPAMGIVGAVVILIWAYSLLKQTSAVLLDREMDHGVVEEIREVIAQDFSVRGTTISDLHVWRVGQKVYSVVIALDTQDQTLSPDQVRKALSIHEELVHITVEINHS